MRLYHVSEEPDIRVFEPRPPKRGDVGADPLVWAIHERCLPNFLTPRDCPRVTYHAGPETAGADIERFFANPARPHAVAIEAAWFPALLRTTLYLYRMDAQGFVLQDEGAGYYVSKRAEIPLERLVARDLPAALFARGVELRVTDALWPLADAVQASTLRWSLCRMGNAAPRGEV